MLGIMGAMPEEINDLVDCLEVEAEHELGGRTYYVGLLWGKKVVLVFSRWGKVAAASTVSTLILKFNITELIFTGVAGAIHKDLKIGDIVIGRNLYQHDMDARPLMAQFEIPLLGKTYFETHQNQIDIASNASNKFLTQNTISQLPLHEFNITNPQIHVGDIASGDKFFAKNEDKIAIQNALPNILCVEMEGAAVAQVCYEYQIPFTIIRTISDTADHQAEMDFPKFIKAISSKYSEGILKEMLK